MQSRPCVDSASARTALHPCSVETLELGSAGARVDGSDGRAFVVGSYELNEATGDRKGRIAMMSQRAEVLCELPLDAGVLDVKVVGGSAMRRDGVVTLAAAESSGQISLYRYQYQSPNQALNEKTNSINLLTQAVPSDGPFGLALSVDVSECAVVASYQDAAIATFAVTEAGLSHTGSLTHAHSMGGADQPVWTVAFNRHASGDQCFLSGGDDCSMRLWDLRASTQPVHVGRRYDAGVTSAQWHPTEEHVLATGSYDEHVRIWDDRSLSAPIHKIHTGGGVWRTKWTVVGARSFLALACMQAGSRVYELDSGYSVCSSCTHVGADDNELSYGIDVLQASANEGVVSLSVASCSFYNNSVHVWQPTF